MSIEAGTRLETPGLQSGKSPEDLAEQLRGYEGYFEGEPSYEELGALAVIARVRERLGRSENI